MMKKKERYLKMKEYIMNKLKRKSVIVCMMLLVSSLVIGLSYGYFVLSTDDYNASELLIAELLYGINIEEDGSNVSVVNGSNVTLPANTKAYFYVTVSSINKVDSKYTLAYNVNNDAIVKYTDKTDWTALGYIKGYDESTYTKRIRIVIDNTENDSEANVTLKVFGGYTFNSYDKIALKDNYYTVSGPYKETIKVEASDLVNIVKKDTSCESDICMYEGGSLRNYLQYPEDTDKTKNIWRILGTYKDGDKTVVKIISESKSTTTLEYIGDSLTDFYEELDESYIYKTTKFNCTSEGCTTSSYSNIGLISTYEYERVGGLNSYLSPNNSYFALNNTSIINITRGGITETTNDTNSGLRPSIYLIPETKVTGSGTSNDPYIITENSHVVTLVVVNGTGNDTKTIEHGGSETFSISASTGYTTTSPTISCTGDASGSVSGSTLTIKNVTETQICTVTLKKKTYSVKVTSTDNTYGRVSPTSQTIEHGNKATITLSPKTGYEYLSNTCGGTVSGNTMTISSVTAAKTCTVTFALKGSLYAKILKDHPTREKRSNFGLYFTSENTKTLYTEDGHYTEGGKTVYYFAGNALDNWVYFGGYYWRIIRINEDNSVRLLYVGSAHTDKNMSIASSAFSDSSDAKNGVGYTYSSSSGFTDSTIKGVIDEWYETNIYPDYDGYVSQTAIYCNDRSGLTHLSTDPLSTRYAGGKRWEAEVPHPSFKCGVDETGSLFKNASIDDKYTKSTSTGNGKLTYPVALLTADEIIFAGRPRVNANRNNMNWMGRSSSDVCSSGSWYTMTPWGDGGYYRPKSFVYYANSYWSLRSGWSEDPEEIATASTERSVRPVLSLKSCVLSDDSSADGSSSKPYKVKIDSTCAGKEN